MGLGKVFKKTKVLFVTLFVVTMVILLRLFVAELCVVPSDSMKPAIYAGDYAVYEKFTYGGSFPRRLADIPIVNVFTWIDSWRESDSIRHWSHRRMPGSGKPEIGDVVVFRSVVDNQDMLLVKRLAQIVERGTEVYIDSINVAIVISMAARDGYILSKSDTAYIPMQNFYYMLGDNTSNSTDSRCFGYIPESSIEGKMIVVLWSWDSEAKGLDKMRWERILHIIR